MDDEEFVRHISQWAARISTHYLPIIRQPHLTIEEQMEVMMNMMMDVFDLFVINDEENGDVTVH